jgi:hypothetical protein
VLYTQFIRPKGSDRELAQPGGLRVELHDGKVTRRHPYLSWEETLQAAGLRE